MNPETLNAVYSAFQRQRVIQMAFQEFNFSVSIQVEGIGGPGRTHAVFLSRLPSLSGGTAHDLPSYLVRDLKVRPTPH